MDAGWSTPVSKQSLTGMWWVRMLSFLHDIWITSQAQWWLWCSDIPVSSMNMIYGDKYQVWWKKDRERGMCCTELWYYKKVMAWYSWAECRKHQNEQQPVNREIVKLLTYSHYKTVNKNKTKVFSVCILSVNIDLCSVWTVKSSMTTSLNTLWGKWWFFIFFGVFSNQILFV